MNVPHCYIICTLSVLILTSSLFAVSINHIQYNLICAVKLFIIQSNNINSFCF